MLKEKVEFSENEEYITSPAPDYNEFLIIVSVVPILTIILMGLTL